MGRRPSFTRPPSPPRSLVLVPPPHMRRALLVILGCASLFFVLPSLPYFYPRRSSTYPPFASVGRNETLTQFLDARWPRTPAALADPHLWLTISSKGYIDEGTAALGVFVERLNVERGTAARAGGGSVERETAMVVLCLDDVCLERCEARGLWCYGGYRWNRPEQVSTAAVDDGRR